MNTCVIKVDSKGDNLILRFTILFIFVVFVNMFAMLYYYYVVGGGLNLMLIELVAQPHCT